jgi:hypothetical protein
MRKGIGTLLAAAGILVASVSFASDTHGTRVVQTRIGIGSPSVGIIQIDRDPANIPACATYTTGNNAHGRWFAVDLSTDGGREAFRLAMAAQLAGKPVRMTGSGTCTVNSNKENVSGLYMD